MSDHEKIYLEPENDNYAPEGRQWREDNVWDGGVEYVRADIHEKQVKKLSDALWKEFYRHIDQYGSVNVKAIEYADKHIKRIIEKRH